MPGEKEINVNLFERLDLIERLEMAAETRSRIRKPGVRLHIKDA